MRILCEGIKRKCKITWKDKETDDRVKEIVENAAEAMRHKLGISDARPEIFLQPGLTKSLYQIYCMYDWNNMLDEFEQNYMKEILTERHRYEVENAKKKSQQL